MWFGVWGGMGRSRGGVCVTWSVDGGSSHSGSGGGMGGCCCVCVCDGSSIPDSFCVFVTCGDCVYIYMKLQILLLFWECRSVQKKHKEN